MFLLCIYSSCFFLLRTVGDRSSMARNKLNVLRLSLDWGRRYEICTSGVMLGALFSVGDFLDCAGVLPLDLRAHVRRTQSGNDKVGDKTAARVCPRSLPHAGMGSIFLSCSRV